MTVIAGIILSRTCLGRDIYAVGGNAEAAFASGISTIRTKFKMFAISGIFTGIAAVIQMARLNTGMPDTAEGYHGDAIAAAVIAAQALPAAQVLRPHAGRRTDRRLYLKHFESEGRFCKYSADRQGRVDYCRRIG